MMAVAHEQILKQSLTNLFSDTALKQIVRANVKQDSIVYSLGLHNHFHYDNNEIAESDEYIKDQRDLVFNSLRKKDGPEARQAFGHLTHTAQDFYAHTNYISLWIAQNQNIYPDSVDPLKQSILANPRLCSGKIYFRELLTFIPFIGFLSLRIMPSDSHAKMNIDHSDQPNFKFVFVASVKRTIHEYKMIAKNLSNVELDMFTDKIGTIN